ncbi:MAG: small-conductance mechanosensitive channel [Myxococcota bacterium]|jgi:small-conductance mechanosensitive channel
MPENIQETLTAWTNWVVGQATSVDTLVQLGLIVGSLLIAWALLRPSRSVVDHIFERRPQTARVTRISTLLKRLVLPTLWLGLVGAGGMASQDFGYGGGIARDAASLLAAWLLIRITSSLISEPFWAHTVATIAWSLAALNILHLLDPALAFLDSLAFSAGEARISILSVIKALFMVAVLLYGALALSGLIQSKIRRVPNLTPSIQVLLSQVTRFGLIVAAFMLALGSVGIDLSSFAVVGGAIGVGIGFGLQKVVSNLISGIILLLDRSIKPGDVIEVGETYGEVNSLGARYTSVITRDGTEWLIPNEDLITQRVTNWSFSSKLVRRKIPIGIAYDSDLDLATQLILEAARETDRIVNDPVTKCLMKGFGDNSIDLEVRYWIEDPEEGVSNIADVVLRKVWKKFREHGIEIPFPQRDLYIKNDALRIQVDSNSPS